MFKTTVWPALAVFVLLLVAGGACATPITGNFSATVGSGANDTLGVFGGGSQTGKTITISYSYDPAAPGMSYSTGAGGDQLTCTGCSANMQFSATIGGNTVTSAFSGFAELLYQPVASGTKSKLYFSIPGPYSTEVHVELVFDAPWTSGLLLSGNFPTAVTSTNFTQQVIVENAAGQFDILPISGPAAASQAPEPASLTLMGIGLLALAGLSYRVRRLKSSG